MRFKAIHWDRPAGNGITRPVYVHLSAVAKRSTQEDPYVVANEIVAGHLGRFLGLPVPDACIVDDDNGVSHYASLDFALAGESLPPIIPAKYAQRFPDIAASVLAFDILIANSDRHHHNMAAYYDPPQRSMVFDHSHALLARL